MNYVIIGNGIAGIEAALNIRKIDEDGAITIITDSPQLHYYRPGLIKYLAGEADLDKIITYDEDYYAEKNITNRLNIVVSSIDTEKQIVLSEDGESFSYDRLLLATGAKPFVPPIKGSEKEGVFTVRTAEDTDIIRDYIDNLSTIVVVGGGLLGLENAHSFLKLGKKVIVVEAVEWLLPRQLDPEGGRLLQKLLEEKGMTFVLNDSVASIDGDSGVSSVTLKSGEKIETQAVVISAGVRSNTSLAEKTGININQGIVVNDHMETSVKNIFAAGDAIEHNGKLYGLWMPAREQGALAGRNMAGEKEKYTGSQISAMLKVTGIDLFSAGDINEQDASIRKESTGEIYKKLGTDNNGKHSAIVLGDKPSIPVARKVLSGKADPEEFIADN